MLPAHRSSRQTGRPDSGRGGLRGRPPPWYSGIPKVPANMLFRCERLSAMGRSKTPRALYNGIKRRFSNGKDVPVKKIGFITTNKVLAQSLAAAVRSNPDLRLEPFLLLNPHQATLDADLAGIDIAVVDVITCCPFCDSGSAPDKDLCLMRKRRSNAGGWQCFVISFLHTAYIERQNCFPGGCTAIPRPKNIVYFLRKKYNKAIQPYKAGEDTEYMTVSEAAGKWGVSGRSIARHLVAGRITGALKKGRSG